MQVVDIFFHKQPAKQSAGNTTYKKNQNNNKSKINYNKADTTIRFIFILTIQGILTAAIGTTTTALQQQQQQQQQKSQGKEIDKHSNTVKRNYLTKLISIFKSKNDSNNNYLSIG